MPSCKITIINLNWSVRKSVECVFTSQFTQRSFCLFRKPCRFGHDLMSDHNAQVLGIHKLESLDKRELCILLLQNDNSLLPPVSTAIGLPHRL